MRQPQEWVIGDALITLSQSPRHAARTGQAKLNASQWVKLAAHLAKATADFMDSNGSHPATSEQPEVSETGELLPEDDR